ncbi:aminoacyltransferase [Staphylococcus massiliensis]|uniref:aminoacyltransferase n=1 Tax=Staphylococcus massiliensis TaxID=555791 RepID=UPI001EDD7A25|nr:aminoacyltransferase [Staphylococcus massiliensis]MCG3412329.1 aminoacyltransferase [Staphylococcus massiliensis]
MFFQELELHEFEQFMKENFSHYTQSLQNYEFLNNEGKTAYLLGVKDEDGNVLAACLLNKTRALKYFNYFYTHRGPVMDYDNVELVDFFFSNLNQFLKANNCLYVRLDPHIMENLRDADGHIIQSFNNKPLMAQLKRHGYIHQGFDIGYDKISQIRWLSVLDLEGKSEKQLLKNMNYQTRRNIKKTDEMGVKVKTLPIEETNRFFKLFQMAEEKHGFSFRDEPYFEKMQKVYKDNGFLKLAYIDLEKYLAQLEFKLGEGKEALKQIEEVLSENPNSKKNKNKFKQTEQTVTSTEKKVAHIKELIQTDGKILDLAAALYVYNDHEVYYLSSGSNPKYNEFMGAYALQWEMIKFGKKHGINKYNFYGITGDFSDEAEDFGVQQFKKGFDAKVEEYIGDFIKPVRPVLYQLFKLKSKI